MTDLMPTLDGLPLLQGSRNKPLTIREKNLFAYTDYAASLFSVKFSLWSSLRCFYDQFSSRVESSFSIWFTPGTDSFLIAYIYPLYFLPLNLCRTTQVLL